MQGGNIAWLGNPTTPSAMPYSSQSNANFTMYLEGAREDTTELDVSKAVTDASSVPDKIKIFGHQLYVSFISEERFHDALSERYIRINHRTLEVGVSKNNDIDKHKGLLGFWQGKPVSMDKLYEEIDKHGWKVLFVKQMFWPNGPAKHYEFLHFRNKKDKEDAMWSLLQINGKVLQVYEVKRNVDGSLKMPVEGEWRKKIRSNNQTPMDTIQTPKATANFKLRAFSD